MANKVIKNLLFISLFISLFTVQGSEAKKSNTKAIGKLTCNFIGPIQGVYFNQHINYKNSKVGEKSQLTKSEIEKRTVNQFVKKLDGSKIYLLEKDVNQIKGYLKTIVSKIEKESAIGCKNLKAAQEIFTKRVGERVAFAKQYLGKGFKFNKNTKFVFDPDKRSYSVTRKAADKFQKMYIQFQVSNFLATDLKLREAKDMVIRSYERNLRRVKDMTEERLFSSYLNAFSSAFDPHSSYFSAESMADFRISMSLSLDGIGASLSSRDGYTVVEQLITGGAAAGEGSLRPKDKILAVGQDSCEKKVKGRCPMTNVIEMDLRDVVKQIRGKKGTKVHLTILRATGDKKERFNVAIIRDKVKLEDDAASITYVDKSLGNKNFKIGLINLPSFYADSREGGRTATKDLKKLLVEAKKNKVDGVVLDFSSNGGGSLDDAVNIAGLFFKKGAVVKQSSKRRDASVLNDEDKAVNYNGPLVILTSRVSASASEIVAGTLKDYKRAVIVGADHTFGKGTVQSVIPLPSGLGAAKVTVGMFYIAGGNSTQHRGVEADVILPGVLSNDEVGEKTLDYSLPPTSLASFLSPSAYVKKGENHWELITEDEIKKLKNFSEIRVSENKEFKKILVDIEKNKKSKHIVDISETFKERSKSNKKEKEKDKKKNSLGQHTKAGKLAEYLKRADIQEAMYVATDLVALKKGLGTLLADSRRKAKKKK